MSVIGLFGRPYQDLEHLLSDADLRAMDQEVTRGLVHAETSFTGGSLKWMGVVAPWCMEDGYRDLMQVIETFSQEELAELRSMGQEEAPSDRDGSEPLAFGDETDHPLSLRQMKWLSYRYGVYFPWKCCYHLLENDKWEDKHSGAGKAFGAEASRLFPETIRMIRSLPFLEIGRAVIFGLEPNDHAPLHRDTEPKKALAVAQSISIEPRGTKRFYLQNEPDAEPLVVDKRVYWFNDMDYHGVLPDPFFRYSIRVDGRFDPAFLRQLERRAFAGDEVAGRRALPVP